MLLGAYLDTAAKRMDKSARYLTFELTSVIVTEKAGVLYCERRYIMNKMGEILYLDMNYSASALCDCPDSVPAGDGTCETGADDCTCEDF